MDIYYMAGPVPRALHVDMVMATLFHLRKPRLPEVKSLAQSHSQEVAKLEFRFRSVHL